MLNDNAPDYARGTRFRVVMIGPPSLHLLKNNRYLLNLNGVAIGSAVKSLNLHGFRKLSRSVEVLSSSTSVVYFGEAETMCNGSRSAAASRKGRR